MDETCPCGSTRWLSDVWTCYPVGGHTKSRGNVQNQGAHAPYHFVCSGRARTPEVRSVESEESLTYESPLEVGHTRFSRFRLRWICLGQTFYRQHDSCHSGVPHPEFLKHLCVGPCGSDVSNDSQVSQELSALLRLRILPLVPGAIASLLVLSSTAASGLRHQHECVSAE